MKKLMAKPGWKTTEFWLSILAMIIAVMIGSDAFTEVSLMGKILAFGGTALTSLGYTAGRSMVKSAELKARALTEAAQYVP